MEELLLSGKSLSLEEADRLAGQSVPGEESSGGVFTSKKKA